MAKKKLKLAVIDFETDPFLFGRIPKPFAWGFYNGHVYEEHWEENAWESDKCVESLMQYLESLDQPHLILAHNGGKFDFLFFINRLKGELKIVNGRILQADLFRHTLRDSYSILPIPLAQAGGKLGIDYKLMERECREGHKEEIMVYLKADCVSLYNLVEAFYEEFGDVLTIGSASMAQLKKFHEYDTATPRFDANFRQYYFGGRCQCFETGVIETVVNGYDLNSSYPHTMRSMKHPVGVHHYVDTVVDDTTAFIKWSGKNRNAVPTRMDNGSLNFEIEKGVFSCSIHEFNAGLDTGTIEPDEILESVHFDKMESFDTFIDHFYTSRLKAKAEKDIFHDIFYKLILNSAYGKFAQSPESFEDSIILPYGEMPPEGYEIRFTHMEYAIWAKPSTKKTYFNVATAASITGGSRATLLRGLANCIRPLYCDTDSIYCNTLKTAMDSKALGAWKHEFTGDQIAIAGKKMYAVMGDGECLKKASKGVTLNPLAIFMIARGDTCETRSMVPAFKLDGNHQWIQRNIRRTK